ncbi:arsenate reductase (glutaredoxin) [Sulfurimonas sp.]
MSKLTLIHNPRCSKSREALKILEENGVEAEIVKYLDTPLGKEAIENLLKILGINARDLMRTKESIYKELNLKDVTDEERLIKAMVEHPKLIERPIVIQGDKAVIGRPPEKIVEFLKA